MRKTSLAFLGALLASAAAGGYVYYQKIHLPRKYQTLRKKIIAATIAAMDPDRLAGQPLHIAIPGKELTDEARRVIKAIKPGGIIFFGFNLKNAAQIKKLTTDLQALAVELSIPPFLIATDQEGGYVKRV